MEPLRFALLGLGGGAVYALAAIGIVLIHRGSGVVNFAHGVMAFWGAWAYASARTDAGMPTWIAVTVGVGVGCVFGFLTEWIALRRLRGRSELVRMVAVLGVLTTLHGLALRIFGDRVQLVPAFLPTRPVRVTSDLVVGADRLVLVAVAVAATAVLWLLQQRTRFGLSTLAVGENDVAAAALGHSPTFVASVTWTVGGGLAALAGVLVVHITGLDVSKLTYLVLPALAASLIGRFRSLPVTLLGGLLLGVGEAEATRYLTLPGAARSVPLLVIIAVLATRSERLWARPALVDRLPAISPTPSRGVRTAAVVLAVCFAALAVGLPTRAVDATITTATGAIVLASIVLVAGFTGQLSLAQFALAGIGAWASSRVADLFGLPFVVCMLVGVVAAAVAGLLLAAPAMRSRGVSLAIVTLGMAVVVEGMLFGNRDLTGGFAGTRVPSPTFIGIDIDPVRHADRYAMVSLAALAFIVLMLANVRRGPAGRRLVAIRGNERAAAALGVNVTRTKLAAFALSAAIAGLAGTLIAFRHQTVVFEQFDWFTGVTQIVYAVVGGIGFLSGAAIGAFMLPGAALATLMAEFVSGDVTSILAIAGGVLLVALLAQQPDGLAPSYVAAFTRLSARWRGPALIPWGRRPRHPRLHPDVEAARHEDTPRTDHAGTAEPARLAVVDMTVSFGGIRAVDHVTFAAEAGEVTAVIGPNGAGKTTLLDAIGGYVKGTGSVLLDGTDLAGRSPSRRSQVGLGRTFQSLELFSDMTVRDNLLLACDPTGLSVFARNALHPIVTPMSRAAADSVSAFGLAEVLDDRPDALPYGTRRLVAVARALAGQPRVLLLDEPAAGLDAVESARLGALIRSLADVWKLTIVLVEHDMQLVTTISDRVVVLDHGSVIADGPPTDVCQDRRVVAAYLGTETSSPPTPSRSRMNRDDELSMLRNS